MSPPLPKGRRTAIAVEGYVSPSRHSATAPFRQGGLARLPFHVSMKRSSMCDRNGGIAIIFLSLIPSPCFVPALLCVFFAPRHARAFHPRYTPCRPCGGASLPRHNIQRQMQPHRKDPKGTHRRCHTQQPLHAKAVPPPEQRQEYIKSLVSYRYLYIEL